MDTGVLANADTLAERQALANVDQNDIRVEMLDRWDGPRWRWWALAGGAAVVAATALIALPASLLFDRSFVGLLMLGLIIELLSVSFVGAGMLDSVSRKMNQGGLARDANDIENDPTLGKEEKERMKRDQQDQFDRRTLRAGIAVLPILGMFFYLLFSR